MHKDPLQKWQIGTASDNDIDEDDLFERFLRKQLLK